MVLKGSPDSILSPSSSVKIQIMGGKVCLKRKGKTLLGIVKKTFENKKFVGITQQCFALFPLVMDVSTGFRYKKNGKEFSVHL